MRWGANLVADLESDEAGALIEGWLATVADTAWTWYTIATWLNVPLQVFLSKTIAHAMGIELDDYRNVNSSLKQSWIIWHTEGTASCQASSPD